ncbi:MAG: hypothetical protein OHK0031_02300 [Anaerolineales bacterium]
MKKRARIFPLLLFLLSACLPTPRLTEIPPATSMFPTATPLAETERATLIIGLDMGSGGAGFSATLYAQDVTSGKNFHTFLSAGMHGASTLPTSAPVMLFVRAPATYVFFARLTNAPDEYHYGATTCGADGVCVLQALKVEPGQTYHVTINDSAALLPELEKPVSLPWRLAP